MDVVSTVGSRSLDCLRCFTERPTKVWSAQGLPSLEAWFLASGSSLSSERQPHTKTHSYANRAGARWYAASLPSVTRGDKKPVRVSYWVNWWSFYSGAIRTIIFFGGRVQEFYGSHCPWAGVGGRRHRYLCLFSKNAEDLLLFPAPLRGWAFKNRVARPEPQETI